MRGLRRGLALLLVTGAAGFIGFHLSSRLLERGTAVLGFDNMNPYYDPALKRARLKQLQATAERTGTSFQLIEADLEDLPVEEQHMQGFRRDIRQAVDAGLGTGRLGAADAHRVAGGTVSILLRHRVMSAFCERMAPCNTAQTHPKSRPRPVSQHRLRHKLRARWVITAGGWRVPGDHLVDADHPDC